MLQTLSTWILRLCGWTVVGPLPAQKKYLIIGAPHTSNWDFPLALLALASLDLKFSWIGKHTLFKGPVGYVLKKIGGIPVDRRVRLGFIDKIVTLYNENSKMVVAIAPEGTRSKKDHWKTGFYYIAHRASLPIALGFVDYKTKRLGIGKTITTTEDIEHDFAVIREFYDGLQGKRPQQQSEITIRPRELQRIKKTQQETTKNA